VQQFILEWKFLDKFTDQNKNQSYDKDYEFNQIIIGGWKSCFTLLIWEIQICIGQEYEKKSALESDSIKEWLIK